MKQINEIYAYVAEEGGCEGIISMQMGNTHMPLVGADVARHESLKEHVKQIAKASGKKIKLLKFTNREEVNWE